MLQNTNAITKFMPLYIGAAHRLRETALWGSPLSTDRRYDQGTTTPAPPRLPRLPPSTSTAFTLNGGVWACHAPLALRSCPVHPARLIRSDSRRVRRTGYNIISNGTNGNCLDEDNCK
ncbi:unnamed protein product [Penicillium salamii]|nr:unnamed protein product [Penicillium salamii]